MIYIGAENIVSPLGLTADKNFEAAIHGKSALCVLDDLYDSSNVCAGIINKTGFGHKTDRKIEQIALQSIRNSLDQIDTNQSGRWLMILSTTKGDVDFLATNDIKKACPTHLADRLAELLDIELDVTVISNACISGVSAIIKASDELTMDNYDHVLVVGVDLVTQFTLKGFESFFALSSEPCKPFDTNRAGLNIGEGCGTLVLSKTRSLFNNVPCQLIGGATSNDANHISGPSRTGEGLYRSIQKTLKRTGISPTQIDYISAHGTATRYNDDMESIAFNRLDLQNVPVNSFKGIFGHTLGAAGVIEVAMSIRSILSSQLIQSHGVSEPGTVKSLNVLTENKSADINTVLKTASGFGGCNASVIVTKLANDKA